jgi:hypothetical protein
LLRLSDLNFLWYDSFTEQGQLLWVGICLTDNFEWRFSLVSMVPINLGIWFYGAELSDAGETIEREESQWIPGFQ